MRPTTKLANTEFAHMVLGAALDEYGMKTEDERTTGNRRLRYYATCKSCGQTQTPLKVKLMAGIRCKICRQVWGPIEPMPKTRVAPGGYTMLTLDNIHLLVADGHEHLVPLKFRVSETTRRMYTGIAETPGIIMLIENPNTAGKVIRGTAPRSYEEAQAISERLVEEQDADSTAANAAANAAAEAAAEAAQKLIPEKKQQPLREPAYLFSKALIAEYRELSNSVSTRELQEWKARNIDIDGETLDIFPTCETSEATSTEFWVYPSRGFDIFED